MRAIATGLLIIMAVVFVVSRSYEGGHAAIGFIRAFSEAAMIGALADWFAVTALFRHPLGIAIPHTAIIPNNKDRIADTLAQFLKTNFLIPQVVARRMGGINLAQAIGDFLVQPGRVATSQLRTGVMNLVAEILESLDPDRLGAQVKAGLRHQLEKIAIAPALGGLLAAFIADRRHIPLMETMIRWAGNTLEQNEDLLRQMIHARTNAVLRWTGLDEKLANSVVNGLYRMLAEMLVDPAHPMRLRVQEGLESLADRLRNDPALQERVEGMKNDLLANPAVGDWWQGVWERLRRSMIDTARNPDGLSDHLGHSLAELGEALRRDQALQTQINRFFRRSAVAVTSRYGNQLVQLVSQTVRRWDATTITDRVEGAVGRDLQFIRINGTLVGGLVGLCIHGLELLVF
ncbi:DUF445 domain-containing protein [Croceicoccus sp. F390]|uniref:DUF445 domain-containing protein n=1 Tax=Croceicoccus esteveae TaxID=3075597 RepID=A0ABU2ZGY3_9SPHN|nr:DUF445 domain-containing protein [Croceicoccus sp. F390]MDT0574859.1 DUF445 domain-containing protein [Croceicoccus sp. F390]